MAELYTISDEFNQPQGRWQLNAGGGDNPWDPQSTVFWKAIHPASYADFLGSDQRHIDLRSFRSVSNLVPVPQYPDLDTVPQYPNLDTVFQTALEVKPGDTFSENWRATGSGIQNTFTEYWDLTTTYNAGDGVEYKGKYYVATTTTQGEVPSQNPSSWTETFFVGKLDNHNAWYGLRAKANGSNINCTFSSFIDEEIDISSMDYLSIVLPDHNAVNVSTSTVKLYSGRIDSPIPSAAVAWGSYLSANELRIPLGNFAATNFDFKRICGIEIHIEDTTPPANNTPITIMAIRAIDSLWVPAALDFDTRWGIIYHTPSLSGSPLTNPPIPAKDFEFVRGDGTRFDPIPSDGAYTMFFYGGGEVARTAVDPLKNKIGIILRESSIHGDPGTPIGKFNNGASQVNMIPDTIYAVKITTPASAGVVNSVFWHLDSNGPGTGAAKFRGLIYSDNSGEPGIKLGQSYEVQLADTAPADDYEFVFTSPVSLSANTSYWLAIHGDGEADSFRLYYDTVSNIARRDADTYADGSPDPWDTAGDVVENNEYTAYTRYSTDSGMAIYTTLEWNDVGLWFTAQRKNMVNGTITQTTQYVEQINSSGLDPTSLYAWTVKLIGTTLNSEVIAIDQNRNRQSNVWTLSPIDSQDWTFANGRVGFLADLLDKDAYIDALITAPVGFALLRSKVYESRDPVDGVRIQAVYSPDANLFTELVGTDAFRDQTKTVSGEGSIRTLQGLTTNTFVVEDWHETYLTLAIWCPTSVTPRNQPYIVLNFGSTQYPLKMPTLKGAQWNFLYFELANFKNLTTGLGYSFSILPGISPDIPLGFYWVDSVVIGRRKVAWAARANPTAPFRRFRGMANRADGALHFNPDERGRHLQIEAQALTPDAWISEFTLFPHYAELGLPVYDQGFETR
jgi:hypothetical protein